MPDPGVEPPIVSRMFTVTVEATVDLTIRDVWPDGDGPPNPTCADVVAAMKSSGTMRRVIRDWGIDDAIGLSVYSDGDHARWSDA